MIIANACVVSETQLLREAHKGVCIHQYITQGIPAENQSSYMYIYLSVSMPQRIQENRFCSLLNLKLQLIMGLILDDASQKIRFSVFLF